MSHALPEFTGSLKLYHGTPRIVRVGEILSPSPSVVTSTGEEGTFVFATNIRNGGLTHIARSQFSLNDFYLNMPNGKSIPCILDVDVGDAHYTQTMQLGTICSVSPEGFKQHFLEDGTPTLEWTSDSPVVVAGVEYINRYADLMRMGLHVFSIGYEYVRPTVPVKKIRDKVEARGGQVVEENGLIFEEHIRHGVPTRSLAVSKDSWPSLQRVMASENGVIELCRQGLLTFVNERVMSSPQNGSLHLYL